MVSQWNHVHQLFNDLETFTRQDRDVGPRVRRRQRPDWTSTDVDESPEALTVTMDVPGLTSEDVSVSVGELVLTISGSRERPERPEGEQRHAGRRFGSFSRTLQLGSGLDPSETHAQVSEGVLTITIPKLPERQPHRVQVH
jgi:HSP20 family protein